MEVTSSPFSAQEIISSIVITMGIAAYRQGCRKKRESETESAKAPLYRWKINFSLHTPKHDE
jgi:hypothetical protein